MEHEILRPMHHLNYKHVKSPEKSMDQNNEGVLS